MIISGPDLADNFLVLFSAANSASLVMITSSREG